MSRDDAIAHLDSLAVLNGKANLRDLLEPLVPLARAAGSQLPFYVIADDGGPSPSHADGSSNSPAGLFSAERAGVR